MIPASEAKAGQTLDSPAGIVSRPGGLWRTKQVWVLSLLLLVATVALYYPSKDHPFVNYDDDDYVTTNHHVQAGLTWETIQWSFTSHEFANWHPLTWLSHALDCQLFGVDPGPHHETNLLFHGLNVVLLFWVLAQATGYFGRSAMVAALFALHPMNVESVAWIAERKNLLSMFFFLLALAAYRWYARAPKLGRYLTVAGLYALGLMAKPQVITLPCVLLLWDYWPLQRMFPEVKSASSGTVGEPSFPARSLSTLLLEKLPLFLLAGVSAHLTQMAQQASGGSSLKWTFLIQVENAIVSYARYLGKAIWPSRMALFYPHPAASLSLRQVALWALLLLAITAVVVRYARQYRFVAVGWFWFLGTMVPMSGIIANGDIAMADRYAYLPFIGLFLMICWTVAEWAARRHIPTRILAVVSLAALLALTVDARVQLDYWQDNVTLWTHALQVTPDNSTAETNLGSALTDARQFDEALFHYRAALAISPLDPVANLDVGFLEAKQGDFQGAIAQYQRVIDTTQKPDLKRKALVNLGYVYRDMGDMEKARASFAQAKAMQR
jgi:tetratricopeptide (TPR) repeat protein